MFRLHGCLCTVCIWRPEEGVRAPRTGITDGCELPYGCREWSLEEQPVPLTAETSPARALYLFIFYLFVCLFILRGRISLCSPGCPGTHSVDQAGLELRDPPASAS